MGLKIFLDTNIVIYFVEKHRLFSGTIELLLNGLNAADETCVSPLVRMECLVMPLRTRDVVLQNLYEQFFAAQTLLPLPVEIFDRAAHVRADFPKVKTPDALHIATALHYNCDEFWTNDNRLDRIAPSLVKNILTP